MADHIQIDDVTPRIAYTATAGQTVFAIPFAFFADEDLDVYVNDVLNILDTDYTVAGEGNSELAARKVTFVDGLTVGDSVVIVRDITIERTTDFPNSGPLQIPSLNTQFDKIFAIMQQLANSIVRTLRLGDSDTTSSLDIPAAAARANKFLAFDAAGDPVMATAVTGSPVSAYMATVLDDANAAAARTTLGIADTSAYVGLANWHHCY